MLIPFLVPTLIVIHQTWIDYLKEACRVHENHPKLHRHVVRFRETGLGSISSSGDVFPSFDAHKGKVAAMAQQRPFQLTLA